MNVTSPGSERLYAAIVESSGNAIVGLSLDGTVLSWNAAAGRLYGYNAAEIVGHSFQKLFPPGEVLDLGAVLGALRQGAPVVFAEVLRRRKDGALIRVPVNVSPIRDAAGDIVGVASITNDVTQRNQLQQALHEQDQRFRALIEEASDVVMLIGADGRIGYVSTAITRVGGYEAGELLGKPYGDYVHPDDAAAAARAFMQQLADPQRVLRLQLRLRHRNGSWLYADAAARNLLGLPGVNGIVFNLRDVTDRVAAEQARRESDERLTALVEHASDVIALVSRAGSIEYASPALAEVTGLQPDEVRGSPFLQHVHPDDRAAAAQTFADLAEGRAHNFRAVWRLRHRDGSWRIVEAVGRDCSEVAGVGAIIVNARDVTERRKLDQARRDGDAMLRAVTRSARDAILLVDNAGRIAFWNEGAAALYGYAETEMLGRDFTCVIPPQHRELARSDFQRVAETGQSPFTDQVREALALTRQGEQVPVEITFTPVRLADQWSLLQVVRNIAERKRAEAEHEAHTEAVRQALVESIQALAATLEARDPYTAGHSRRVAELSVAIAGELGLEAERIRGLRLAAGIHDIGKIAVPTEILTKPGHLSDLEVSLVRTHAEAGYEILKNIHLPWPIAEIIRQHHERLDGSGYPRGLKGADILLEARIVAVADVVESMMQHRPYRGALGSQAALDEITAGRGSKFDAGVVDACLKLFNERHYAFAA